jgi:hypothetical protein
MARFRPTRAQNKALTPPDFNPFKRSPKLGPALTRTRTLEEKKKYKCRRPKVGEKITRKVWVDDEWQTVTQTFTTEEATKYVQLCSYKYRNPRTGNETDRIKIIRTKKDKKKFYNAEYWRHLVASRDEKGGPKYPNQDRRDYQPEYEPLKRKKASR